MVRNKSQTFSVSERKTLLQAQKTVAEVQIKFVPFKFCGQVIWFVKANGFFFPKHGVFLFPQANFPGIFVVFCRTMSR